MLLAAPGLNQTSVIAQWAHNILPSLLPSFLLASCAYTACRWLSPPAPLSPESLENPSDQRWVPKKLSDFGAVHSLHASSSSPSLPTMPPWPLTGLNPPLQSQHCFHYWESYQDESQRAELMLQLIVKFRALITAQNQAELQPLCSGCHPSWLSIMLITTAT